jgi:hypothetical protein
MASIRLTFRGQDYVIPENRAFEAGEAVEEIVTLSELVGMRTRPRFHKLARCYGELLRYAGCRVTDREVHSEIMGGLKGREAKAEAAAAALNALIEVLMDGAPDDGGEDEDVGKTSAS